MDKIDVVRTMTVQMDIRRCYFHQYGFCHKAEPVVWENDEARLDGYWKCVFLVDNCRCPGATTYDEHNRKQRGD